MQALSPPKPSPLRTGHRNFTRARICSTAREIFARHGFAAATMEEIATAGGIGRSTLYNHFRDKNQILIAIAGDYAPGLCALPARLPATPTIPEITAWLREVSAFVAQEHTPTILITDLGNAVDSHPAIVLLGQQLLQALAARHPAFRRAVEPGPDQGLAFARASIILREIGVASLQHIRHGGEGVGKDLLTAVAELLGRFLNDQW